MNTDRDEERFDLNLVQRHLENVKRQVVKQWNEMQYGRIKLQLKVIIREKKRLNQMDQIIIRSRPKELPRDF